MNNAARGQSRRFAGRWWIDPDDPDHARGGWLDSVPNPMPYVDQLPERKGTDKAKENYKPRLPEMRRYTSNLHMLPEDYAEALTLQLLTVARIGETAELPWSELDLEEGVWILPVERAKNKNGHTVQLPRQAVEILQRRRAANPDGLWVFPSKKYANRPVSPNTLQRAISARRVELGICSRFTSHCVRHGALSWMASNGIGREIRDALSNHLPRAGVDREYVDAELETHARDAVQRWADVLSPSTGTVVPMRGLSKTSVDATRTAALS